MQTIKYVNDYSSNDVELIHLICIIAVKLVSTEEPKNKLRNE